MDKRKRNKIILGALLVVVGLLALYLVFGDSGLLHIYYLKTQKTRLETEIDRLKAENDMLRKQIERLTLDSDYMEQVIRDKLGYVKPEESIILFKPPQNDQTGYQ